MTEIKRRELLMTEGMSADIGRYFSAMEEVRAQLREAVAGLTDEQLARRVMPRTQPISVLLLHIGEAEWWWLNCIIANHEPTEEERQRVYWDIEFDDETDYAQHGYSAKFCFDTLDDIRQQSRRFLESFGDGDLDRIFTHTSGERTREVSLRWTLHHLIDHEANHKGQIMLLKRLLVNRES